MPVDICMLLHKPADNDSRVLREAQALQDAGFDVLILSISPEHTQPVNRVINGIAVHDIPVQRTWWDQIIDSYLLKTITYLLAFLPYIKPVKWLGLRTSRLWLSHYRAMIAAVRTVDARIFHANDYHTLALPFITKEHPLVVYDVHDLEFDRVRNPVSDLANRLIDRKLEFERSIETDLVQACAAILVVSEAFVDFLKPQWNHAKIVVIRNLVDVPYDLPPETIFPIQDKKTVIHIGNQNPGRQLDVLINAFQYLPEDIALVLMGKGSQTAKLKDQAKRLNLDDRIHFVPPASPHLVAATAAQADISAVLNPGGVRNREYTYPQKFFESLAAGLPVVAGKTQSLKHLVEKYDLGVLVDVYDPVSVAEGIRQLLDDETRQQYRKNVEKARETLNWNQEKQALVQLYEGLLK